MKRNIGLLRCPAMQNCIEKKIQDRNKKLAQSLVLAKTKQQKEFEAVTVQRIEYRGCFCERGEV